MRLEYATLRTEFHYLVDKSSIMLDVIYVAWTHIYPVGLTVCNFMAIASNCISHKSIIVIIHPNPA